MRMLLGLCGLVIVGCTGTSVDGTVGGQPFTARDAYFSVSRHANGFSGAVTTYTGVHFTDYDNACDFGASVPSSNVQIGAALYTDDPRKPTTTSVDLSVKSPGH